MFKVDAIFRLERLEEVTNVLVAQGFEEFTVTEVRGHGSGETPTACYRGITYETPFVPQARLELSVSDDVLDLVIECITKAAHTGKPGDGKILVTQLADVIEIRIDRRAVEAHDRRPLRPRLAAAVGGGLPSAW